MGKNKVTDSIKSSLEKWQSLILKTDLEISRIRDFFNCVDCDFIDAFEKLQIEYTNSISKEIGDNSGWLEWFWLENKMGKNDLEASHHGEFRKVETLDDLIYFIAP